MTCPRPNPVPQAAVEASIEAIPRPAKAGRGTGVRGLRYLRKWPSLPMTVSSTNFEPLWLVGENVT
jgi:hypothetical protein